MKFGLFDHIDRNRDMPLDQQYRDRLEFLAAADEAGFYSFHVAEHHATPLNTVPVPGVFLGAVARETSRMRLGPLTYLLPLYSPLRLIEEVAILDQLSGGRLDVGVGRGVSAFELNYHNIDVETSRAVFAEALEVLIKGLTSERLTHKGEYFNYTNVPMELEPLQRPYPPIWYPSSNTPGAAFSGGNGYHYVTLGAGPAAKACIDSYKEAYAKRGAPAVPDEAFPGGTAIGIMRRTLIAETDEEAWKLAEPAYMHYVWSHTKLRRENIKGPADERKELLSTKDAFELGTHMIGSPETVRAEVERQIEYYGVNYMTVNFYHGNLAHDAAMRSMKLFADEVMPKLSDAKMVAE